MEQYYSDEKNVQILIALLKAHGVKRIIASPGSTNVTFVGSIQQDPFFEIFSCVDERSAAYMACGMAAEIGAPVALSCTGATASRNYFSALTEAYYRKLPIIAITSTQDISRIGHLIPQTIYRDSQPNDVVKTSVYLQNVKDEQDEWDCMIKANKALLEVYHHGTGPVHINLATNYNSSFRTKQLPVVNVIRRYSIEDELPRMPQGKIAIYVGSHQKWDSSLTKVIDCFCQKHNAVVFYDPTSNYNGHYGVCYELAALQQNQDSCNNPDLLIHIGNMSDMCYVVRPKNVRRVSEDGEISDRYKCLRNVFEMKEFTFFNYYAEQDCVNKLPYYGDCETRQSVVEKNFPELPFSHIWCAKQLFDKLPVQSVVHFGILSPLRSWSFFSLNSSIEKFCNQGGFGIDGNLSSMIGASIASPQKLFFGIVGDLSFFYDMNCLGNRHIGNNIRILLINNSLGAEFHLFKQANSIYVNEVDRFISAGGHFSCKSKDLVKNYVTSLGFEYFSADNKEVFNNNIKRFVDPGNLPKPIVFEVFTKVVDENEALYRISLINSDIKTDLKSSLSHLLHDGRFTPYLKDKYNISLFNIKEQ